MAQRKRIVNFGVIGLGMGRGHLEGYMKAPNSKVVGLADLNETRLKDCKDRYGVSKTFTNYHDLLALKNLDAVSIAVPNFLHNPITLDALKAGKHVLVEKPMALNAQEGQEMLDMANKHGLKLMLQFNNRYRGDIQFLKRCVDAGDFGEIYFAKTGWVRRRGVPGAGTWFTDKKEIRRRAAHRPGSPRYRHDHVYDGFPKACSNFRVYRSEVSATGEKRQI